jgi:hypothetical protein
MWNIMGKTGNKNAQKNVHYAQFSGHRNLDASVIAYRGKKSTLTLNTLKKHECISERAGRNTEYGMSSPWDDFR